MVVLELWNKIYMNLPYVYSKLEIVDQTKTFSEKNNNEYVSITWTLLISNLNPTHLQPEPYSCLTCTLLISNLNPTYL